MATVNGIELYYSKLIVRERFQEFGNRHTLAAAGRDGDEQPAGTKGSLVDLEGINPKTRSGFGVWSSQAFSGLHDRLGWSPRALY